MLPITEYTYVLIYIYIHIICTSIFLIIATIISIIRIRIFVSFVFFLVCTKNMDCFFFWANSTCTYYTTTRAEWMDRSPFLNVFSTLFYDDWGRWVSQINLVMIGWVVALGWWLKGTNLRKGATRRFWDQICYSIYCMFFFQYEHTYRIPEHYDLGFRTNPKSRAKSRNKDMMTPGKNGQKIHGVTVFLFLGPCNLNQWSYRPLQYSYSILQIQRGPIPREVPFRRSRLPFTQEEVAPWIPPRWINMAACRTGTRRLRPWKEDHGFPWGCDANV